MTDRHAHIYTQHVRATERGTDIVRCTCGHEHEVRLGHASPTPRRLPPDAAASLSTAPGVSPAPGAFFRSEP